MKDTVPQTQNECDMVKEQLSSTSGCGLFVCVSIRRVEHTCTITNRRGIIIRSEKETLRLADRIGR